MLTNGVAGDVLDLKGAISFGAGGFLYSNPSGGTGNGAINLDGATLNGIINSNGLGRGAVNVTNNSTLNGTYYSSADLGINSGKQFNISGSTLNFDNGSLTNNGTLAIGNGTLNNGTAGAYSLGGGGGATLAGGTISGANGFTSDNTLTGYGTISAPFTNTGNVTLTGGASTVSGTFTNQAGANLTFRPTRLPLEPSPTTTSARCMSPTPRSPLATSPTMAPISVTRPPRPSTT